MITFLPSKTFTVCAKALDDRRLLGQVGEAKIILMAILDGKQVGQPAFDMWRKHPGHLAIYGKIMSDERHLRFGTPIDGFFPSHIPAWFYALPSVEREHWETLPWDARRDPPWLGDLRLHRSHIRRLYEKDTTYYAKWRPILQTPYVACCVGCNYWWPTHVGIL